MVGPPDFSRAFGPRLRRRSCGKLRPGRNIHPSARLLDIDSCLSHGRAELTTVHFHFSDGYEWLLESGELLGFGVACRCRRIAGGLHAHAGNILGVFAKCDSHCDCKRNCRADKLRGHGDIRFDLPYRDDVDDPRGLCSCSAAGQSLPYGRLIDITAYLSRMPSTASRET